jgi:hypothetical protein
MTNTTTTIPATENEAWGFWGTMRDHAERAWPLAITAISDATMLPTDAVRAFLDSRYGRHFADGVTSQMYYGATLEDAIAQTTAQWMQWRIGRQTSRDYGIPRGMPYLTGFVIHAEVEAEA